MCLVCHDKIAYDVLVAFAGHSIALIIATEAAITERTYYTLEFEKFRVRFFLELDFS
mgnify:CR=1 FL=1